MPRALVTVGSTKFDLLIQSCLSEPVLSALKNKAFTELVIQSGNSQLPPQPTVNGLQISLYTFKPSLSDAFSAADLVISHAGSGTIIEVLRLRKPLIIVPNPTLMDNHQRELAQALSSMNVCKVASIENLAAAIEGFDSSTLAEFPASEAGRFRALIDEEMGF